VASNNRNGGMGCLAALILTLVIIFVPIIGHIVVTVMILGDDLSSGEKLLWLVVVWVFWFIGPFLYLLLGQKRNRLFSQLA
jgi:Phospholipase_D-nuclease N-terminal